MKEILAFIAALCIGIGCSEPGVSPTVSVSVISDRPRNSDVTTVVITVENATQSSVSFTQSKNLIGFWRIEQKIGNDWVEADRATINYGSLYPNERKMLAPGEMLRDTLTMSKVGTYRMGFPFTWDEYEARVDSLPTEEFIVQ